MIIVSLNNALADREEIDDLSYKIFSIANNFLSAYFILNDEILSKNSLNYAIINLAFINWLFCMVENPEMKIKNSHLGIWSLLLLYHYKTLKLFISLASSWIFLFEFWWEITFSLASKIIISKLFQTS